MPITQDSSTADKQHSPQHPKSKSTLALIALLRTLPRVDAILTDLWDADNPSSFKGTIYKGGFNNDPSHIDVQIIPIGFGDQYDVAQGCRVLIDDTNTYFYIQPSPYIMYMKLTQVWDSSQSFKNTLQGVPCDSRGNIPKGSEFDPDSDDYSADATFLINIVFPSPTVDTEFNTDGYQIGDVIPYMRYDSMQVNTADGEDDVYTVGVVIAVSAGAGEIIGIKRGQVKYCPANNTKLVLGFLPLADVSA